MKPLALCAIFCLAVIATVAAALTFGSPDIATVSLLCVGIVVAGKEIDTITSLETLQELRNDCFKAMDELRTKFQSRGDKEKGQPGSWADDEQKRWEDSNSHYDAVTKRMDELRASDDLEKQFQQRQQEQERSNRDRNRNDINQENGNGGDDRLTPQIRSLAFQGWLLRRMGGNISKRHRAAMKQVKLRSSETQLKMRGLLTDEFAAMQDVARTVHRSQAKAYLRRYLNENAEERALSAGTVANKGADFIPEGFISDVEVNMLAFGSVLQAADVLRTSGGNTIPWPTFNDVGNKGRQIGENTSANTTPDPASGKILFGAYKFTSDAFLVPYELLEDESVAPRLPQILAAALGERLGRIQEERYTTGNGTTQPQGVVTASALGITTAGQAIVDNDIIELEHSVDPAYRMGAAYMMHDSITLAIRLLQDSEGRFLWRAGLTEGRPDMLNGRPVYINQEMDSAITTGNKIMLFGDFMKFKIRQVNDMRLYRLEERFRLDDQDGFVAFNRSDSKLLNAGTNPIKHLLVG